MNLAELTLNFGTEKLLLTNQRALYWQRERILVISDLHLGKAAHFRKNGIAIPKQVTLNDLLRLERLLQHYPADKLLIVGDLIHAGNNSEIILLHALMQKFPSTRFVLIKGNHDRLPHALLQKIGIQELHESLTIGTLNFSHEPDANSRAYSICGHIHPGVRLKLPDRSSISLPCFAVTSKTLVLPAFSHFTGLDTKYGTDDTEYFALTENAIFTLKGRTL